VQCGATEMRAPPAAMWGVLRYVANIHRVTGRETIAGVGNAAFAVTPRRRGASVGDEARKRSTVVDIALIVNELTKFTARRVSTRARISEDVAMGAQTRAVSREALIWANARTVHDAARHARGISEVHRVQKVTKFTHVDHTY
jgi:hypothetical protein